MNNFADETKGEAKRGLLWHLKWLLACYAAALGLSLLAIVVSLPFSGFALVGWWFKPAGSLTMLLLAVVVSPLIYRRLK